MYGRGGEELQHRCQHVQKGFGRCKKPLGHEGVHVVATKAEERKFARDAIYADSDEEEEEEEEGEEEEDDEEEEESTKMTTTRSGGGGGGAAGEAWLSCARQCQPAHVADAGEDEPNVGERRAACGARSPAASRSSRSGFRSRG